MDRFLLIRLSIRPGATGNEPDQKTVENATELMRQIARIGGKLAPK
jgi:hypothetical protein